ncbi:hypothetical protein Sjap_004286 [Stephania japonica]|uniref:Cyclin n=1 Tax=Stephania japonica TaxID=461633 RepID=A0AAP0PGW6_9MAGN
MASPSFAQSSISPSKLRSDLYAFCPQINDQSTPSVISVLASLLDRAIAKNERIDGRRESAQCSGYGPWTDTRATRVFECSQRPDITVQAFLERIFRYARVAPPIYVVAYVYIDRLCEILPGFRITRWNVHRLLITAVMVASKFVEDTNYKNSYFAKVGGLSTREMNDSEFEFLFLMGFRFHVNVSVFDSYCCHLEREVSIGGGYQIERSLWFMCGGELKSSEKAKNGSSSIHSNVLLDLVRIS